MVCEWECTWGVCEALKEQMCMPALFRVCVQMYDETHTRIHTSIMSLWSLQSNSFRQKSLKQPRFWSSCYSPSVSSLLTSHQPLLLPKITQERHSNPRLTTAQLGHKRGIKTHTKKETHHIVEEGGKEHSYSSVLEDIYWWFWRPKKPHILMHQAKTGKSKVCLWMCVSMCANKQDEAYCNC